MIELYYWPTPNGWKITIALEELGLRYRVIPVDIGRSEQFEPAFTAISPNQRIPAIVDRAPSDGLGALAIFESAAILRYLADKAGVLLPRDPRRVLEVEQWLAWQVAGLGPMLGQAHHFREFAPDRIDYAVRRYTAEAARLYAVLDRRLDGREFVADEAYSIADIAIWPWIRLHAMQGQRLEDHPNVRRWFRAVGERPAVARGCAVPGRPGSEGVVVADAGRRIRFDSRARAVLFLDRTDAAGSPRPLPGDARGALSSRGPNARD